MIFFCKDYHFFYNSDIHIYDKQKTLKNYNKIVNKHFLKYFYI